MLTLPLEWPRVSFRKVFASSPVMRVHQNEREREKGIKELLAETGLALVSVQAG